MADNVTVRVPEQQFIRGEDGFDPAVTIEDIEHGHRVTITDREHPVEGQSFDVMDGASAYEQAVDGDYEGTEEEFNADLASFKAKAQAATNAAAAAAQSAQNAADSATTATTKAQEAADSAAAALTRMNSANSSAQAAANSATDAAASKTAAADSARAAKESEVVSNYNRVEAERSATAASRSASSASTAATTAQGHATNAASSATAAGNAQTAAETAQGKAEDAQAAAEQAKSDAETAAQSVSQSAAQIGQNTSDIDNLKSALDMFKAKNVLQTALTRGEYIKGSNPNGGTPTSSNGFCRTTALLRGYGEKISVEITDPTYEYYVSYYGENGSLDGTDYLGYSGYQRGTFVIPENAVKIGITFRRVDHASLAADELTKISNAIYYTGITDTSLSLSGKAADAKSAGQAIANATFYWSDDTNSLIRTYDDVISKYDELCALYPNYITKNALTSGDFTNYEYVLTIGNYNSQNGQRGQDPEIEKPVILISAGVHGYERSSVMGLYGFVKAMCENVTSLNKIIYAANYRIIPIVCPSGYTNDSRVNSNGVNINRNFATTDWALLPTGDNYSGAAPADQPETKVLQTWLENHNDALLYIDWHNSAYINEISCLLGLNTTEATKWKKKYLTSLDNVIPWWMKGRNIPPSNIYAYTGSPTAEYSNTGTAVTYAREHNIETAFVLETSWNVIDKGRHARFSIGVGQEAFSNMMIGFADLINDSNIAILG